MVEATDIVFTPLNTYGGRKRALVTATASQSETITLDSHEYQVGTILKVCSPHVAATGVAVVYSYATNVLTRTTAGTDVDDVIEIIYQS